MHSSLLHVAPPSWTYFETIFARAPKLLPLQPRAVGCSWFFMWQKTLECETAKRKTDVCDQERLHDTSITCTCIRYTCCVWQRSGKLFKSNTPGASGHFLSSALLIQTCLSHGFTSNGSVLSLPGLPSSLPSEQNDIFFVQHTDDTLNTCCVVRSRLVLGWIFALRRVRSKRAPPSCGRPACLPAYLQGFFFNVLQNASQKTCNRRGVPEHTQMQPPPAPRCNKYKSHLHLLFHACNHTSITI